MKLLPSGAKRAIQKVQLINFKMLSFVLFDCINVVQNSTPGTLSQDEFCFFFLKFYQLCFIIILGRHHLIVNNKILHLDPPNYQQS